MTDETRSPPLSIELADRAKQGDSTAREQLFERYYPRVARIVALRVGKRWADMGHAEDIVQKAMMRAFDRLETFSGSGSEGAFRGWISRIVESQIREHFRHENAKIRGGGNVAQLGGLRAEGELGSSIFMGNSPTPSVVAVGREFEERLETALLELREHDRELIILHRLEGKSYAEIAEELGFRQEAAVRKALSRAIGRLEEALGMNTA